MSTEDVGLLLDCMKCPRLSELVVTNIIDYGPIGDLASASAQFASTISFVRRSECSLQVFRIERLQNMDQMAEIVEACKPYLDAIS